MSHREALKQSRFAVLLEQFRQAQLASRPAPSNLQLREILGVRSTATVSQLIGQMHQAGLIRVTRVGSCGRHVHVTGEQPQQVVVAYEPPKPRKPRRRQQRPIPQGHMATITASPWRSCQFLTDSKLRDFCGAPTHPGSSYCPNHHRRCYQPPEQRKARS